MSGFTLASMITAAVAIIGSPIAWAKLRGERTNIWISASKGAVIVQGEVIEDLREQITALRGEVDHCRRQMSEVYSLQQQVAELRSKLSVTKVQRDRLKMDNDKLSGRVAHLEHVLKAAGLDGET